MEVEVEAEEENLLMLWSLLKKTQMSKGMERVTPLHYFAYARKREVVAEEVEVEEEA